MKQFILMLTLFFVTTTLNAECPSTITYSNGSYMKSGNTLYYQNGSYLKSGSTLYYPNGSYFKSGSNLYYPNGSYLKSGSTVYYPNGGYLKSGSTLYYSNGSYLKSGNTFYYKNGSYSRSGRTLHRENGESTGFPVQLKETVGNLGTLHANLMADSERLSLRLYDLIDAKNVELRHIENILSDNSTNNHFVFVMNSGHPGEAMRISISEGGDIQCSFQDEWDDNDRYCAK